MQPVNQQQEILVLTGTGFARSELKSKNTDGNSSRANAEQLELAFWNGMLFELLPELKVPGGEKMYMWRINNYGTAMAVRLGTNPEPADCHFSIDPYLFAGSIFSN